LKAAPSSTAPARPVTADVGVKDGRIAEVGRITEAAARDGRRPGAWLTPGFVDIHTHYDGQASWDETFSPSIHHGVTTLVMGNCGVGFAPLRRPEEQPPDQPDGRGGGHSRRGAGRRASAGTGRVFPQYMDRAGRLPHSLDFACLVPHDPLRMYVMGERARWQRAATADDIAPCAALLREALQAGAIGFSTGRSDNHRTSTARRPRPPRPTEAELTGHRRRLRGPGPRRGADGQRLSTCCAFPERFDAEFDLVEQLARAAGDRCR
jgi:N-acyl-D-aspartate/D-glutamate deacylase